MTCEVPGTRLKLRGYSFFLFSFFPFLGVEFNTKKVIQTKARQTICGKTRILDGWGDDFEIEIPMVFVNFRDMWRDKAHVNPSLTMKTMGWGQSFLLILSSSVALNLASALCFFRLEVRGPEVGVH